MLFGIVKGQINNHQFDKALFFLLSPASYICGYTNPTLQSYLALNISLQEKKEFKLAHFEIAYAIENALLENRVKFLEKNELQLYKAFNVFLKENGIDPPNSKLRDQQYNYPTLKETYSSVIEVIS